MPSITGRWSILTLIAATFALMSAACSDKTAPAPAVATTLTISAGNAQSGQVGTGVAIAPAVVVKDQNNHPMAGVAVSFTVTAGGGSVTGSPATTNADGIATLGRWTLGSTIGANALSASVGTLPLVTFSATGLAGPASSVVKGVGDSQTAVAGSAVAVAPSVRVMDVFGNPVSGIAVTFAVASGGGSITGGSQLTSSAGVAAVGSWVLGAAGPNSLLASVSGATPVTFTAAATSALTLSPSVAAAAPKTSLLFTATDTPGGRAETVRWRINNVDGGSAAIGFISVGGQYTAPAVLPDGDSIVVTAVLASDTTVQRRSTVFFVPNLTSRGYFVPFPRVVEAANPKPTRFLVVGAATATQMTFQPVSGPSIPLTNIGNGVFSFVLPASTALAGYEVGTLHNFIGTVDSKDAGGTSLCVCNYAVNVREANFPDVAITSLGANAQKSPYVLNMRLDTVTVYSDHAIRKKAVDLLGGDQFDFIAVIGPAENTHGSGITGNRVNQLLRNDVSGIGLSVFDNTAPSGGTGRLKAALEFPVSAYFDGAEHGFVHEAGHTWINWATRDPVVGAGVAHWPASSMARHVMGANIANTGVGGSFPWLLTPVGSDSVKISNLASALGTYAPIDLYLMGLIPADSVPSMLVLPPEVVVDGTTNGKTFLARKYSINDYIASQGPRVPAVSAQKSFATATVLLTYGRLATPAEMAFFDMAAKRGETTTTLRASIGRSNSDAVGFYQATGGRARMTMRLP
jgi:hypothetical protein